MLENYSYYIPEKAKELVLDHLGQSLSEEEEDSRRRNVANKNPAAFSIKQLFEQGAQGLASPFNAISAAHNNNADVAAARSPLAARAAQKFSPNPGGLSALRQSTPKIPAFSSTTTTKTISSSKSVGDLKSSRGREENNVQRKQRRRRKRRTRTGSMGRYDDESSDRDSVMTRSVTTTDSASVSTDATMTSSTTLSTDAATTTSSTKSEDLLRFISFDDEDEDDENIYTTVTFKTVKPGESESVSRRAEKVVGAASELPPHHR